MKGSNQQLTPMILAPARAIRTAHSPGLVPCNTAITPGYQWSVVPGSTFSSPRGPMHMVAATGLL